MTEKNKKLNEENRSLKAQLKKLEESKATAEEEKNAALLAASKLVARRTFHVKKSFQESKSNMWEQSLPDNAKFSKEVKKSKVIFGDKTLASHVRKKMRKHFKPIDTYENKVDTIPYYEHFPMRTD